MVTTGAAQVLYPPPPPAGGPYLRISCEMCDDSKVFPRCMRPYIPPPHWLDGNLITRTQSNQEVAAVLGYAPPAATYYRSLLDSPSPPGVVHRTPSLGLASGGRRLVMGAERDRIVDEAGIKEMATFLDTDHVMLPTVPHEVSLGSSTLDILDAAG